MVIYLDAYSIAISVALFVCLNAVYTKGSLQEQYIGCYQDTSSQSNWTFGIKDSKTLSIERCIETCEQQSTTYAIFENGRNCLCGNVLDVSSPNYACDTRCSGNGHQVCGGSSGTMSSYVIYSVCPIGFYGSGCDQMCHCKHLMPCYRSNGICPDGCEESWTQSSCNKLKPQALSDVSLGCYFDSINRTMEFEYGYLSGTATVELCSATCASRNYTFAGIEVGSECFCGASNANYVRRNDTGCSFKCDGDRNQFCGGSWALNVYFVCPTGYFGSGCMSRCNCKNEQRCTCASCTCSSGCKSGWMGSRCEFRDCSENNGNCSVNETCVTIDLKFASITRCSCKQGYQKRRLWDECTDLDECGLDMCDPNTTKCTNTIGDFACICRPGYERENSTHCRDIPPTTSSTGLQRSLDNCEHVYSVGVVIGAAVGSAVGSIAVFATILVVVVLCRRRQQKKNSEDGAENRSKEGTDAKTEQPISSSAYEALNKMPKEYDSTYTELTGNDHRPETTETRKRYETGTP